MPSDSFRSCSRLSTTACTDTSSAAVGSSRMTRSGLERDRARDADARLLPAGELMRKAVEQLERQADLPRQFLAARAHGVAALDVAEPQDRIGDGARRGEARIEAVGRVLEHHLDALAQRQRGEFLGRDLADVLAVEHDDAVGLVDQPHHHVEVVDLPQPDLPTRPTLSPRPTVKLMPSTARKISGSGAGPRRNSFASELRGALARIFLDQLLDHQQRLGRPCRSSMRDRPAADRRRLVLRQQIAQRHAGPRRRAHQLARIGDAPAR